MMTPTTDNSRTRADNMVFHNTCLQDAGGIKLKKAVKFRELVVKDIMNWHRRLRHQDRQVGCAGLPSNFPGAVSSPDRLNMLPPLLLCNTTAEADQRVSASTGMLVAQQKRRQKKESLLSSMILKSSKNEALPARGCASSSTMKEPPPSQFTRFTERTVSSFPSILSFCTLTEEQRQGCANRRITWEGSLRKPKENIKVEIPVNEREAKIKDIEEDLNYHDTKSILRSRVYFPVTMDDVITESFSQTATVLSRKLKHTAANKSNTIDHSRTLLCELVSFEHADGDHASVASMICQDTAGECFKIITDFRDSTRHYRGRRNQYFDKNIAPYLKPGHVVAIRYAKKSKMPHNTHTLSLRASFDGSKEFSQIPWCIIITDASVQQVCIVACSLSKLLALGDEVLITGSAHRHCWNCKKPELRTVGLEKSKAAAGKEFSLSNVANTKVPFSECKEHVYVNSQAVAPATSLLSVSASTVVSWRSGQDIKGEFHNASCEAIAAAAPERFIFVVCNECKVATYCSVQCQMESMLKHHDKLKCHIIRQVLELAGYGINKFNPKNPVGALKIDFPKIVSHSL